MSVYVQTNASVHEHVTFFTVGFNFCVMILKQLNSRNLKDKHYLNVFLIVEEFNFSKFETIITLIGFRIF